MTVDASCPPAPERRQRAAARPRRRAHPLRAVASRDAAAWQLRTTGVPEVPLDELVPAGAPARRPGRAGRGVRARPRRALHPAHPPPVLRRPRRLPARLVHHEVQPQGVRRRGRPARPDRRPPRGARRRAPRGGSELLVELEEVLCAITGMAAATLQPAAGAAGELTGLLLMRAWHEARGDAAAQGGHPGLGPRHQPGVGDPRRLRGGHRARATPGAASTWTRCGRCSTRTWPASC